MKEIIDYYYSMKINEIYEENGIYHFFFNGDEYLFYPYNHSKKDVDNLKAIVNVLANFNFRCHMIIENSNKEILTNVDNVYYILLKLYKVNSDISIIDMVEYNKKTLNILPNEIPNWYLLWQKRIDFVEDSLNSVTCDKIIKKTIDYYLGLSENAISYVYNVDKLYGFINKDIILSHRRIYYPNSDINYFNPVNFIADIEARDIAEYLKSVFFAGENAFDELVIYLSLKPIDNYNANMLFARLLFPNYYLDCFDKWLNKKEESVAFLKIIKKQKDYELFLKKAYLELSKYAQLEKIDWLID